MELVLNAQQAWLWLEQLTLTTQLTSLGNTRGHLCLAKEAL